ncbi:MAG: hypothetical protein AB7P08_17235 [Burkholderiales bacterium]
MSKDNPTTMPGESFPPAIPAPAGAVPDAAPSRSRSVSVAYHEGPPSLTFAGRLWHRGVAQSVPAPDWAAMQQRLDFRHFNFKPA